MKLVISFKFFPPRNGKSAETFDTVVASLANRTLSHICGTAIPAELQLGLDRLDHEDQDAVVDFGVNFAVAQCRGLLENGVTGLHFYTMDRSHSTTVMVTRLRQENLL